MSLPAIVIAVLFLALSAFWTAASWWMGREIDAWLQREASLGRQWTCPDRQIAGFPFRIELSCVSPSFTGRADGHNLSGTLQRVLAVAQIYKPSHVIVEADGPLVVRNDSGAELRLSWTLGRASVIGLPDTLDNASVELTSPDLKVSEHHAGEFVAKADLVDFHVRRTPGRPAEDRAYDVASRLTRAAIPALDRISRDAGPLDADVVATLTQAEPLVGIGLSRALERWHQAGGRLQVTKLDMSKGQRQLSATGTLALDDARRAQGRMELSLVGLDDILHSYGLSNRAAAIGGLLAGVLSGKQEPKPDPANRPPAKPGNLTLPLRLENGRAFLGPLAVAVLTPVY